MKNEKEFLDLIKLYKKIDLDWLDEIAKNYEEEPKEGWGQEVLSEITGFGNRETCTLCNAVKIKHREVELKQAIKIRHKKECTTCTYVVLTGNDCFSEVNQNTYWALENAISTDELSEAIDARIKHMETIYKNYKENEKPETNKKET